MSESNFAYVLGFMFSELMDKVALIRRTHPDWQRGFYNGIGGKIEENEKPIDAIVREFREETGTFILPSYWEHVITLVSKQFNSLVYIYKTTGCVDHLKTTTDEVVTIFNINDIPNNIIPNLRWMIPLMNAKLEFPITIVEESVIPFD